MAKSKKTIIPPSLQPRKNTKKAIPGSTKSSTKSSTKKETTSKPQVKKAEVTKPKVVATPAPVVAKQTPIETTSKSKIDKKRFTLWLESDTYRAFKVHVAMSGGSASDYIESLIKRDLNL